MPVPQIFANGYERFGDITAGVLQERTDIFCATLKGAAGVLCQAFQIGVCLRVVP